VLIYTENLLLIYTINISYIYYSFMYFFVNPLSVPTCKNTLFEEFLSNGWDNVAEPPLFTGFENRTHVSSPLIIHQNKLVTNANAKVASFSFAELTKVLAN